MDEKAQTIAELKTAIASAKEQLALAEAALARLKLLVEEMKKNAKK